MQEFNEVEYKALCSQLRSAFPRFVEYKKYQYSQNALNLSTEDFIKLKVEFEHLGKLLFDVENATYSGE